MGVTAKAPPKKDDGQSPLQVAIKSGAGTRFAVANLLLDRGADVTFQETSDINHWTAPVLHDAVRAAVMSVRGLSYSDAALSDAAFALLLRMLASGANVTALDSFGNNGLTRFALDARQVWADPNNRPALEPDLRRISGELLASGADPSLIAPRWGRSLLEQFSDDPIARFLFSP